MHEASLIRDLVAKIEEIAASNNADTVSVVRVKLGALSHCTPGHFREHFIEESRGTCAEGARVEIEVLTDKNDEKFAQEVVLDSIDI